MNRILKDIGWAAVAVDGFIPPRAFMEFQAYNVLVIASEMRQLKHIEYTPAPDIIHEAAGHAPLLADPEYASFLRRFGEIGSKAISSPHNAKLFRAIRELSILKEIPTSLKKDIDRAEEVVHCLQKQKKEISEMDQLRNLHWWSVEYGLIGDPKKFLLYGAGLLSSIGESKWCLSNQVKKIPFTQEVVYQNFDITQPQPQLYVTPNFAHLSKVLENIANSMGLRKGGKDSVDKLIASEEVGTVELSTGLQISGKFKRCIPHPFEQKKAAFILTDGPTALAFRNQELVGHGTRHHADGFGSPLGKLKDSNLPIEDMTPSDLEAFGLIEGETTSLYFESGVVVKGKVITGLRSIFGKIMLISFSNCTVSFQDEILFQPSWGVFDLAIGASIRSAYAGPADLSYFPFEKKILRTSPLSSFPPENKFYQAVEDIKSSDNKTLALDDLGKEIMLLGEDHWLLIVEFYALCLNKKKAHWAEKALKRLEKIKQQNPSLVECINDGLTLMRT